MVAFISAFGPHSGGADRDSIDCSFRKGLTPMPTNTEAPERITQRDVVERLQSALDGILALLSPEGYFINDSPAVDKAWRERIVSAREVLNESLAIAGLVPLAEDRVEAENLIRVTVPGVESLPKSFAALTSAIASLTARVRAEQREVDGLKCDEVARRYTRGTFNDCSREVRAAEECAEIIRRESEK